MRSCVEATLRRGSPLIALLMFIALCAVLALCFAAPTSRRGNGRRKLAKARQINRHYADPETTARFDDLERDARTKGKGGTSMRDRNGVCVCVCTAT